MLGLIVIFLCLIFLINRKYLKFLTGFIFIFAIVLSFSDSTLSKYKSLSNLNSSILLRAENYFFGLHIFKKNPVWGVGFKSDLTQHLEDYKIRFGDKIIESNYHAFIKHEKTFENIVLAFLVEWGLLFSFVYFSGLVIIFITSWKKIRAPPKDAAGILIISVLAGFTAMSLTFDTLRAPDINWAFHSLLGLIANISNE
jgi:O-antigen ligase